MDPLETSTPLTRFAELMRYLHEGRFAMDARVRFNTAGYIFGDALCAYMDVVPKNVDGKYTPSQGYEAYKTALEMAIEAESFLARNSPNRAIRGNVERFREVSQVLFLVSPNSAAESFYNNNGLSSSTLATLDVIANNLSSDNEEAIMSPDQIKEITDNLDQLIQIIQLSQLDARIKDRMLQTLGSMRTQMTRINVVGANDIFDGMDMYIGQLGRAVASVEDPQQRQNLTGLVDKSFEVMDKIQKLVDFGQATFPMLTAVTRAIGWPDKG